MPRADKLSLDRLHLLPHQLATIFTKALSATNVRMTVRPAPRAGKRDAVMVLAPRGVTTRGSDSGDTPQGRPMDICRRDDECFAAGAARDGCSIARNVSRYTLHVRPVGSLEFPFY